MWARAIVCCVAALSLPLVAAAQTYDGVIGSRLLNDSHVVGDGGLFIGFVNDTRLPLRVTVVDLPRGGQGFASIDMPDWIPARSAPQRADEHDPYALANPALHALGLDFAPFPQRGQARFVLRRYLADWRFGGIWMVDPFATATYHLVPQGVDAGPDSGIDLTLHIGSSGFGGFNPVPAVIALSSAVVGGYGISAGIVFYLVASIQGTWSERLMILDGALHEARSTLFGVLSRGAARIGPVLGTALLLGELAYYTAASASGGKPLIASTHAFVRLGGPGTMPMPQRQTSLQQVVRSRDGRYEYNLTLLALPMLTSPADASIVPDPDDALLVLGVRRIHSAEESCTGLGIDAAAGVGGAGAALLRGRCNAWPTPAASERRDTALDLGLCLPGTDVTNVQGRLDCASRFSGPFEAVFRKYDGRLPGSYTYESGELRVYAPDVDTPILLASLRNPEQCAADSIRYSVTTRQLKQFHSLSCERR